MGSQNSPLARIQALARARQYRIALHGVEHMIAEGFDEKQLLEAIRGKAKVLEEYLEDARYLLSGTFASRLALRPACSVRPLE